MQSENCFVSKTDVTEGDRSTSLASVTSLSEVHEGTFALFLPLFDRRLSKRIIHGSFAEPSVIVHQCETLHSNL